MPKTQRPTAIVFNQSTELFGHLIISMDERRKEVAKALDRKSHRFFGLCFGRCDCKVLAYEYDAYCTLLSRVSLVSETIGFVMTIEGVRFARTMLWHIKQLGVPQLGHSEDQYRGRQQALYHLRSSQRFNSAHLKQLHDNLDFLQGRLSLGRISQPERTQTEKALSH